MAQTHAGNLMLAIQARSYNAYIYLQTGNRNHPVRYVQNKVCGILFENKADYASTYARHSTMCICCKLCSRRR